MPSENFLEDMIDIGHVLPAASQVKFRRLLSEIKISLYSLRESGQSIPTRLTIEFGLGFRLDLGVHDHS